jgi:hypothetical protein
MQVGLFRRVPVIVEHVAPEKGFLSEAPFYLENEPGITILRAFGHVVEFSFVVKVHPCCGKGFDSCL